MATFGEHAAAVQIPEDDCVVCKSWPLADRWARRQVTEWLPVGDDQPMCDECMMTSWQRLIWMSHAAEPSEDAAFPGLAAPPRRAIR